MPKFAVTVHGTGCWLGSEERREGKWRRTAPRSMGFYTLRFVECGTHEEAADRAVAMVREDVKDFHRPDHSWSITVEEVREDAETFAKYAPALGFSWYPEDDSPLESDRDNN
jgi:hypothetical protein